MKINFLNTNLKLLKFIILFKIRHKITTNISNKDKSAGRKPTGAYFHAITPD